MKKEQLEKLTTKRLLAYKKKHFPSRDYFLRNIPGFEKESAFVDGCSCSNCEELRNLKKRYLKEYNIIKEILKKRENV